MTELRIASLLVAVVAGAYAALMLIDCQLVDFGVAAAVCAGSTVAAGVIAYAGRRRGKAVARGRVASWEGRDQQAAVAADQHRPLRGGARQTLDASTRFVDRPGARHAHPPSTQSRHDEPAAVSVPVLMGEQRERVSRWTASPALASREFGCGGVEQPMTPAWNAWRDRVVLPPSCAVCRRPHRRASAERGLACW